MPESVTILNTRPAGQAEKLTALITQAGFQVKELPLITIVPFNLESIGTIQDESYSGLFLSSANGLQIFIDSLSRDQRGKWLTKPAYTLSTLTAQKWEALGGRIGFCSQECSLSGFLSEWKKTEREQWFHPCSLFTRLVPDEFRQKGIKVHNFPIYSPSLPADTAGQLPAALPEIDAVLFFSGSAVENFIQCFRGENPDGARQWLTRARVFCSGPSAASALENHGVTGFHTAETPDNKGMVSVLQSYYR